ncbi:MAG: hypothetical protein ACOC44_04440 [Promethearchaeia archaeon]
MIDEEDDEEVLEKGISWKSVLKNLLVIALIMIGAFIIYFGGEENSMTNWIIGFTFICMGSTLMQVQKQPDKPLRQTLTILVCNLCGLTKVRNYQQGDYVFQEADESCEKCDEPMKVKQVYSVKLKKPTEKSDKLKKEEKLLKH